LLITLNPCRLFVITERSISTSTLHQVSLECLAALVVGVQEQLAHMRAGSGRGVAAERVKTSAVRAAMLEVPIFTFCLYIFVKILNLSARRPVV